MSNYVVTGGFGFLGQFIVSQILQNEKDCNIKIVSRKKKHDLYLEILDDKRVVFTSSDLTKEKNYLFLDNTDFVIHNAAFVGFRQEDKEILYEINVNATKKLIEACKKRDIKRFVYVSSISAVPISGKKGVYSDESKFNDENDIKLNHYTRSKTIAEKNLHKIAGDLDYVVGCPSMIMGPGDKKFGKMIKLADKFPILLSTNPIWSIIDVRDCASALYYLLKYGKKSERYIITNEHMRLIDVMKLIYKNLGKKGIIIKIYNFVLKMLLPFVYIYQKIFKNHLFDISLIYSAINDKEFSNKKIKKLGFKFKYTINDTVKDMVDDYNNEKHK